MISMVQVYSKGWQPSMFAAAGLQNKVWLCSKQVQACSMCMCSSTSMVVMPQKGG